MSDEEPSQDHEGSIWPIDEPDPGPPSMWTSEYGAGLVEYGLLLLIIAVACIGAVTTLVPVISGMINQATGLF